MGNRTALEPPFDIVRCAALSGVPHGFFGSSGGTYRFGFNGPVDPDAIAALRSLAAEAVYPGCVLVAPQQVHGAKVITVEEPWRDGPDTRPDGDAVVTARAGLALAVVTADCAPVLLADRRAGIIAAAHAGWRGAVQGVIENTIAAMEALGASRGDIAAAIGPAIAQSNYEVDAAMRDEFDAADHHFEPAPRREGKERWHFDLPGYVAERLSSSGIDRVEATGLDTYASRSRYHSYRRATHMGETDYCNQISIIAQHG